MRLNFQELLRNPDTCRVRLSMRRSHEMRLSVRWRDVCAGQERCISPKGALCLLSVTEKRSLSPTPHGKAHPATPRSRTLRPCVTLPPTGGCGANPPARLRGTVKNGPTGQMRSRNPPLGCGADRTRVRKPGLEFGLTERRTLRWTSHGKGALWPSRLS